MPLSDANIRQFKTDGFTMVPHLFSKEEVDAMRADLNRLRAEGKLRNVRTEGDGKTEAANKQNLQLCPISPHSRLYKALPFADKVLDAVTSLLGEEIVLHLDQTFVKPGLKGMGTNWHQDNAYFKIADPLKGTAMWIAVDDATIANGTMRLIPGVFKTLYEHDRDPESNHHIRCYPPEELSVPVELEAGGVAFFCYGTPHATFANNTLKDRAGVAYHFLNVDQTKTSAYAERFAAAKDYHPILTGPGATHGKKEYGEVFDQSTWDEEVRKTLGAVAV